MRISQKQVGMETFVASINAAQANPPNLSQLMSAPAAATPAGAGRGGGAAQSPPAVASEKLADGVCRITGGYVALAVELKDYVVVLEGGQSEARGLAILAETKRLIPGKRISTSSTPIHTSITQAGSGRLRPKASRFSPTTTTSIPHTGAERHARRRHARSRERRRSRASSRRW